MTNDQVDAAFQAIHDALRAAQMLYMDLRDAGKDSAAATAKLCVDRLQEQIDNLISKELSDWQQGAEDLIPQLSATAQDVQSAVEQVENDVSNAQKVVSAMASLD